MKRVKCQTKGCVWIADAEITFQDCMKTTASGFGVVETRYLCRLCEKALRSEWTITIYYDVPITPMLIASIERMKRSDIEILV